MKCYVCMYVYMYVINLIPDWLDSRHG